MEALIESVARILTERQQRLVTAESCTGGLVAAHLTGMPGSSEWFEGAFVTYRIPAKIRMLDVDPATLARYSAVSEPVARQMATGALDHCDADISVAITGVAGPGGGDPVSPVGTVWFAWAIRAPHIQCIQASEHNLAGNRERVRQQAVAIALQGVLNIFD